MQLSSFCQKNLPFLSWPNPKQTLSLAAGSSDLPWVWWSLWCRGQTGWPELEIFVSVCGRIFGRQPPASRPVYAQFYKLLSVHLSWTHLYIFSTTTIVCSFQVYNLLSQCYILLNLVCTFCAIEILQLSQRTLHSKSFLCRLNYEARFKCRLSSIQCIRGAQFCNPCCAGAGRQSILAGSILQSMLYWRFLQSILCAGSILLSMLYWRVLQSILEGQFCNPCCTGAVLQSILCRFNSAKHAVLALVYNHPIQTQSAIHAVLAKFYNPSYAVSILQSMLYWRCSSIQSFPWRFNSAIHVVLALFYNPSYIGLILHFIYSVQVHIFFMYNTFYAYLILLPDSTKDAANEQWWKCQRK